MTAGKAIARLVRWVKISALVLGISGVVIVASLVWLWRDRADVSDLPWPVAEAEIEPGDAVTVTWLGVSTLLFDDGETQVLIDGFFSRFGPFDFLFGSVETDVAAVNFALAEFRMNRLAAIIPVHSHFDHAMDAGVVANRSTAVVLGSESTANIARGARLPVDQYQILADRETRQFGDFTITLIVSEHAPLADGKQPWFPGQITQPLYQPAPIRAWKEGQSFSVLISHPRGTTLVQGSAGFLHGNLNGMAVDTVMLGVGGLYGLGKEYAGKLWHETVTVTGAKRVFPVHYDDFTLPFGEIGLFPKIVDDAVTAAGWLNEFAQDDAELPVEVQRLPFGSRIVLY